MLKLFKYFEIFYFLRLKNSNQNKILFQNLLKCLLSISIIFLRLCLFSIWKFKMIFKYCIYKVLVWWVDFDKDRQFFIVPPKEAENPKIRDKTFYLFIPCPIPNHGPTFFNSFIYLFILIFIDISFNIHIFFKIMFIRKYLHHLTIKNNG